jgi:hypothetical protein
MKGLGLAGAGMGVASAVSPQFSDLDELMSDSASNYKHPWWVKTREAYQPTTDIDWDVMKPFSSNAHGYFFGVNQNDSDAMAKKSALDSELDGYFKANKPGFSLRDKALSEAAGFGSFGKGLLSVDFTGLEVASPEEGKRENRARSVPLSWYAGGGIPGFG